MHLLLPHRRHLQRLAWSDLRTRLDLNIPEPLLSRCAEVPTPMYRAIKRRQPLPCRCRWVRQADRITASGLVDRCLLAVQGLVMSHVVHVWYLLRNLQALGDSKAMRRSESQMSRQRMTPYKVTQS